MTKKSPAISLISQAATGRVGLFNFNFSASFFQSFFQCFCVVFAHAFFQSSRCRFYQVFSFFQTQASCATYCFDNSNFVSASSFQNYVEFSFFFSSFNRASSYSVITFGDCARGEVSTCTVDGVSHVSGRAGVRTLYNAGMVVHSCVIKNCDYAVSTWMSSQAQRSGCMVQVRSCTGSNNRIGIYALTALVMSIDNALGATTAQLVSAGGQIFT